MTPKIRPQDFLEDNKDSAVINGTIIRKGTIGAALNNAKLYHQTRGNIYIEGILDLTKQLKAVGLYDWMEWKNNDIKEAVKKRLKEIEMEESKQK